MRSRLAFSISLLILVLHSDANRAVAQASNDGKPPSVAIVELFTSEGCSSCPPADALLRQVHLKQTPQNQLIVGISEHVTYWNSLGWKDPYSQSVFTDRQNSYASHLAIEAPYTPQMVLNGRNQFVGSDVSAFKRALAEDSRRSHVDLHIVQSTRSGAGLDVTFSLGSSSKPLDIIAVLTDDSDRSNVLHGENSGRSLEHVSVARSLSKVATSTGTSQQVTHIALPDSFRIDGGTGHHLILFAQEQHQGAIVGAATVTL